MNLDEDVVAEIITDIRMKCTGSEYCNEQYEEIIQVIGHASIYDYIFSTDDKISIYKIMDLNKQLYQYAPFPELGGNLRQNNNIVTGAEFETIDFRQVAQALVDLEPDVKSLVNNIETLSYSKYIEKIAEIHHRITVIHPFNDGNGRCARALINWMFRIKGLPPIYIKFPEKEEYYKGLNIADTKHEYTKLNSVLFEEVIKSSMQLNKVSLVDMSDIEEKQYIKYENLARWIVLTVPGKPPKN